MHIFYDLETTGTDIVYDQILQFGAILADENLVEVDRFEIRCRLLPWIVPSPAALLVTATDIDRLEDPSRPDFYAMMHQISVRLDRWGPATFIGYNSMRFDEPILQRAFWQALLPPYRTVTEGNARLDLLPLVRAAAWFRPRLLKIPRRDDGTLTFRLDALAPANGFRGHHAHDAIGDVEATLFLARKLASQFPELWEPLAARASKSSSAALVESNAPVFFFHHGDIPPIVCYHCIASARRQTHAILARLDYDWAGNFRSHGEDSAQMCGPLLRVALNKAPLLFTLAEAEAIAGLVPSAAEYAQATFLAGNAEYCGRLASSMALCAIPRAPEGAQVEETIFDGFASPDDERLMIEFHKAIPSEQLFISRAFADPRFRRLALRHLFVRAPQVLGVRQEEQMLLGIRRRLTGETQGGHTWRSIPDAINELKCDQEMWPTAEAQRIVAWLGDRAMPTS